MSFEKTFNKIVRLKTASIILFFITFLCAIGAYVSWLVINNTYYTSRDFEITDDFELTLINIDESGEDKIYNYNVKGSFISKTYSFENAEIDFCLLINESNTSADGHNESLLINEPIEQGLEFNIDYNFSIDYFSSKFLSIDLEANEMEFVFFDIMYGKTILSLFLPLVIISAVSFLISVAFAIAYNVLKKKASNHVSNIQDTLTKMKNKPIVNVTKCPYCNTKVNKNDKRCSGCGATL